MRPSRHETMMEVAWTLARRSTCARRQVGAVLVDGHGRQLATGHNGVAMGEIHCTETPCGGVGLPSTTGLEVCQAVHAEMNALLFCPDVMRIAALYVTASPCSLCVRMLLNTSCGAIYYHDLYDEAALARWERARRAAFRLPRGEEP